LKAAWIVLAIALASPLARADPEPPRPGGAAACGVAGSRADDRFRIIVANFGLAEDKTHPDVVVNVRAQLVGELQRFGARIRQREPTLKAVEVVAADCTIDDASAANEVLFASAADMVIWGRIYDPRSGAAIGVHTEVDLRGAQVGPGASVNAGNVTVLTGEYPKVNIVPSATFRWSSQASATNVDGRRLAFTSVAEIDLAALNKTGALLPLTLLYAIYREETGDYTGAATQFDAVIHELGADLVDPTLWLKIAFANDQAKRPKFALDAAARALKLATRLVDRLHACFRLADVCETIDDKPCEVAMLHHASGLVATDAGAPEPDREDLWGAAYLGFLAYHAARLDLDDTALDLSRHVVSMATAVRDACGPWPDASRAACQDEAVVVQRVALSSVAWTAHSMGSLERLVETERALLALPPEAPEDRAPLLLEYAHDGRRLGRAVEADAARAEATPLLATLSAEQKARALKRVATHDGALVYTLRKARWRRAYGSGRLSIEGSVGFAGASVRGAGSDLAEVATVTATLRERYRDWVGARVSFASPSLLTGDAVGRADRLRYYVVEVYGLEPLVLRPTFSVSRTLGIGFGEASLTDHWLDGAVRLWVSAGVAVAVKLAGNLGIVAELQSRLPIKDPVMDAAIAGSIGVAFRR